MDTRTRPPVDAVRRDGKQIHYRVASPEALAVLQLLYQLYCPKED